MMKTRLLGALEVSALGVGCMGMSHATGAPMDLDEAAAVLRAAVEEGYIFFDTAKNYGFAGDPHHNEKILGRAFEGLRGRVVLAITGGVDFDDAIDLYFQAHIDPNVEPEEVAETMRELIQEGKILHWGLSEVDEVYLRRAHAVCPVTAVENHYNIIDRTHEALIPFLEQENIGWVAHGPMFKGLLSGVFQMGTHFTRDDWRSRLVNDENLERYRPLLEYLSQLATEKNATSGQLALAWLLHKKPYIVPIPGMRSVARLRENAGAIDLELTAGEMAAIDRLAQTA